jgi:hypothetical protein
MAEPRPGFVYILTHDAWRKIGLIKIGRTGRDPRTRLAEITASSGLIRPGRVEFAAFVADMKAVEVQIQCDLGRYRIRRRELFRVDVETARRAIEAASGAVALPPLARPATRSRRRRPLRWSYRWARTLGLRYLLIGGLGLLAILALVLQ